MPCNHKAWLPPSGQYFPVGIRGGKEEEVEVEEEEEVEVGKLWPHNNLLLHLAFKFSSSTSKARSAVGLYNYYIHFRAMSEMDRMELGTYTIYLPAASLA